MMLKKLGKQNNLCHNLLKRLKMKNTYTNGTFGFKPLNDLILIKPIRPPVRQGGLIVASAEMMKPNRGHVLAVGSGKVNEKTGKVEDIPVKVGDVVMFTPGSIQEVKVEGHTLSLIKAGDLLGVEVE
jgi:chaperonin GroES